MKHFYSTISVAALALADPAFADVTAPDLWAEWQAQAALTGQVFTADVAETGTGLVLTNFSAVTEQEGVTSRGVIDRIELTENPDGTVTVTFSEQYTMTLSFEVDAGAPPGNIELFLRHEGLNVEVSGDPDARVYTYTADSVTITEGRVWGGGSAPPEIEVDMTMTDLDTTYRLFGTDPETMRFSSTGSIGDMVITVELAAPPGQNGTLKFGMMLSGGQSTASGSLLSIGALNEANGQIPPGFEIDADLTYGAMNMEFRYEEAGENLDVLYGNAGGRLGVGFSEEAITYDIGATGTTARIMAAELPIPIEYSVAETGVAFSIPLAAGDTPQDVDLRLSVQNLVLGDGIWAVADPGNAIPRNPASLLLDASGQVQLFVDLLTLDPDEMDAPPGELRAVTVSELQLSAAGAELTGSADMTFAPGQIMPMPVGQADLQLSGGNTLLDTLINGGLVPAQEGAFVRGALAAFTRPGAGPDTMETTVEFGADGTITANGIPLP